MELRTLRQIYSAGVLADLRAPSGNRFTVPKGDRVRQHSAKINTQWRICFVWTDSGPEVVEIVDYH
ncbi:MAG: type II toxin-antitoxin system RelE/ParE family toxin [Microbacteriaceae bacterium]